jgi:DNA-binding NtrC family response regulator
MPAALIVDGDREGARRAAEVLAQAGFAVRQALLPADAMRMLEDEVADLLVVDVDFAAGAGLELIEECRSRWERLSCLATSARPTVAQAVEAMRLGADGYVAKPLQPGDLANVVAAGDSTPSRRRERPARADGGIIAASAVMAEVFSRLRKVAGVDSTVLLTGESGTGKEVCARFLHEQHPRRKNGPFVAVHCGAMPESLVESELFGHVKGAFTGAERDRVGKLEQASGGTLFLDEISTMKPEAQVRLLRVLQERRVTRIGAPDSRPIDVRVVVASNQNLKNLVSDGTFRLDLYYRISTFPVALPPLRDRVSDIPSLVELFSRRAAERLGLPAPKRFSADALVALASHPWPGNVRELENVVEYASIVSDQREVADRRDLPPEISGIEDGPTCPIQSQVVLTEAGMSFRSAVTNLERELILQSLRLAEGNKAKAAELLDLKRTTFLEKLRKLEEDGLLPPGDGADGFAA